MKKKIIFAALWSLFAVGVFVLMSFAQRQHGKLTCSHLDIEIKRTGTDMFVTEDDLRTLLRDNGHTVEGEPLSAIDVNKLEKLIATHPAIESVDVYASVTGVVDIKAVQRRPVVRIINARDESYYIDDKGKLMPWSEEYTAPVLVVNGMITDSYGNMYPYSIDAIKKDSLMKARTLLDDIYAIATCIDTDAFMRSQIVQVYVTTAGKFELTPRVGNHRIILGDANDVGEKLKKLHLFYTEGLNSTGNWNRYSVINLEYKNQVVCTKRTLTQTP